MKIQSKGSTQASVARRAAVRQRRLFEEISGHILRGAILPVIDREATREASPLFREFQKLESGSAASIEERQKAELLRLLEHASRNVPYYREVFRRKGIDLAQFKIKTEFLKIPVLTKSVLRERQKDLLVEGVDRTGLRKNASGGSTGKPVEFFQDAEYNKYSHVSRLLIQTWWGVQLGDATASIWGADRDIPEWTWKEKLYLALKKQKVCNAFQMTEQRMENFARELHSWQPVFIRGYATALEMFAHFLLARPQFKVRPRAIESSAETLTDKQRDTIERAFEAPVYNSYGSREVNNIAAECGAHEGLHVNSLTRFVEVVDDEGNPQPPGVPGRVLVTDLTNFSMPFIRYENEDIASWANHPCSCGRPFPLFERVWGRSSDFITAPSGKLIHGEFFTHLFYAFPQVQTFQVAQKTLTDVRVLIVLHPGESQFNSDGLKSQMTNVLGPGANCTIEFVDAIPRTASGKHRFTISSVPAHWSPAMAGKD